MRSRTIIAATLAGVIVVLCCAGGTMAVLLGGLNPDPGDSGRNLARCGAGGTIDMRKLPRLSELTQEQIRNAAIIIEVGQQLGVPPRGWVVAIGTAAQESNLHNLGNLGDRNDHDSLGLFQQRPSQGWGSPAQVTDPAYAAKKFYERLLKVPDWQGKRLTDAAQDVQRSAFPEAYQKWEPLAATVVDALTGGAARAPGDANPASLGCTTGGAITAGGWTIPVPDRITSSFGRRGNDMHYGVDLSSPKGTTVRAAAAGVVLTAECNAHVGGGPYSCDTDGGISVSGCGWYVEIKHADNVATRYCHFLQRPAVRVGEAVTAGQPIGISGSSGNSSGAHLHFEVHLGGDMGNSGAVDPVYFMSSKGVPLGGLS